MKIAIDARQLNVNDGKGRYITELVHALSEIKNDHIFYLLTDKTVDVKLPPNFKTVQLEGNLTSTVLSVSK